MLDATEIYIAIRAEITANHALNFLRLHTLRLHGWRSYISLPGSLEQFMVVASTLAAGIDSLRCAGRGVRYTGQAQSASQRGG